MCHGVTIRTIDGQELCIPLYIETDFRLWHDPNPPDPEPWFSTVLDLRQLITINRALSGVRNEEVRVRMSKALQETAQSLAEQLPGGVSLGDAAFEMPRSLTAG